MSEQRHVADLNTAQAQALRRGDTGFIRRCLSDPDVVEDPATLGGTITLLRMARCAAATDELTPFLNDHRSEIRAVTAYALASMGDERAAEGLEEAVRDEDWRVRTWACRGLGRLRTGNASTLLESALSDEAWLVRLRAAAAIARMGDRRLGRSIRAAIKTEKGLPRKLRLWAQYLRIMV